MKDKLIDIWENSICEGVNRKALKSVMRANNLWHKGGIFKKIRAIIIHNSIVRKTGCEIYPQAKIGKYLYIPHFVGIVVGNTTEIGENCTLFPNVVFGANSSIIGNIIIGNNVTIGAGAVITKDVPDNAIVVGVNRIIGYKEK